MPPEVLQVVYQVAALVLPCSFWRVISIFLSFPASSGREGLMLRKLVALFKLLPPVVSTPALAKRSPTSMPPHTALSLSLSLVSSGGGLKTYKNTPNSDTYASQCLISSSSTAGSRSARSCTSPMSASTS